MYTKESLTEDLKRAGILPSDTLLVHSSMKSIGAVDGGADTVLDVLMAYFQDSGLLVFPTLTHHLNASNPVFFRSGNTFAGRDPLRAFPAAAGRSAFAASDTPSPHGDMTRPHSSRGMKCTAHPVRGIPRGDGSPTARRRFSLSGRRGSPAILFCMVWRSGFRFREC